MRRAGRLCGLSHGDCPRRARDDPKGWDIAAETTSGCFGQPSSRHSRGAELAGAGRKRRRRRHPASRLGRSAQHVPGSVDSELMTLRLRASRPIPGPGRQARLSRLRRPLRAASVEVVQVASRRPAGLTETSACPPGRRCGPGPGLRLAVGRDPVRTGAAVPTARLTGGAVSEAGFCDWPFPRFRVGGSSRRASESGRS